MKVRDLLPMEIDIDVYDDVCEELWIAYCGPMALTKAGKEHFAEVLDYELEYNPCSYGGLPAYIVKVDDPDEKVWRDRLAKAKEFFEAAAGYCSVNDFESWFYDL